jgi:beta-galactosidase
MTVVVDSHENVLVPPFGGAMDYLGYSGIYREVRLEVLNREHITDIEIQTPNPIHENTVVLNISLSTDFGMLEINVSSQELNVVTTKVKVQAATMQVKIDIGQKNLWDCDDPYLYTVDVKLRQNEQVIDGLKKRFGFREAIFKADGFYLNGKKMKLIGLNRHQSYPYIGYAMPQSVQNEDADILKNELGCNMVRTSHYPQSTHFLNRCDEIGLLVMEEIPGWQHIGAEEWQELTLLAVREMIIRDRHHPSIILWGVRINESPDHHELYTKTNALASELDSTRPTGGVRYFATVNF